MRIKMPNQENVKEAKLSAITAAMEWLWNFLRNEPKLSDEIYEQAKAIGFAPRTLRRAGERLCIKKKFTGYGKNKKCIWYLPEQYPNFPAAEKKKLFYSPAEFALALGISPETVLRLIRNGELKALKVGRQYFIDPSLLERTA